MTLDRKESEEEGRGGSGGYRGEREDDMNEHERFPVQEEASRVFRTTRRTLGRRGTHADVVLDLSDRDELGVADLALLLTAQQIAQRQHRSIWLAGLPLEAWHTLHEMGLSRFFRPFPLSPKGKA